MTNLPDENTLIADGEAAFVKNVEGVKAKRWKPRCLFPSGRALQRIMDTLTR